MATIPLPVNEKCAEHFVSVRSLLITTYEDPSWEIVVYLNIILLNWKIY